MSARYETDEALPPMPSRDPSPKAGVSWEEAIRIASALKSWHRPSGLVFVIGIDARSPDDNRVFLSINLDQPEQTHNTLLVTFRSVPDWKVLDKLKMMIQVHFGFFNIPQNEV